MKLALDDLEHGLPWRTLLPTPLYGGDRAGPSSFLLALAVTPGPAAGTERRGRDAGWTLHDSTPTPGDSDQMAKPCPRIPQRSPPDSACPSQTSQLALQDCCLQPGLGSLSLSIFIGCFSIKGGCEKNKLYTLASWEDSAGSFGPCPGSVARRPCTHSPAASASTVTTATCSQGPEAKTRPHSFQHNDASLRVDLPGMPDVVLGSFYHFLSLSFAWGGGSGLPQPSTPCRTHTSKGSRPV